MSKDETFKSESSNESGRESPDDLLRHVIIAGYEPNLEWTREEEKALVRKFDLKLLAFLWFAFIFLNFDRYNISQALTGTFLQDLGITTDVVATGTSILLIGFCLTEIPSNMVIRKVGAKNWLPFLMFSWGIVSTFQIFIKNAAGFYVTRFLIGAFEGGWIPGTILFLSRHYTKNELASRLGFFWSCNLVASALSGLIAYGVLRMQGIAGLAGWQWLFLIEGVATTIIAIIAFFYLPGNPIDNKRWLTERERLIATTRLIKDDPSKATGNDWVKAKDVWKTLIDPNIWPNLLIGFIGFMPPAGYAIFTPYIIKGFGFGALESNLLGIPSAILGIAYMLTLSTLSQKTHRRWYFIVIGNLTYIFGLLLSNFLPGDNKVGLYIALLISTASALPWHPVNAAWISENSAPESKRAIVLSLYIMAVNISGVVGVQFYRASDAPRYYVGNWISIGLLALTSLISIGRWQQIKWINRKRDKKLLELGETIKILDGGDISDKDVHFRYNW